MCLIIFAHQVAAATPLIVSANRDEFYTRPTEQAALWPDSTGPARLLAGRDLLAGGTWLGITRNGRFAAVTNIRDPSQPELKPRSRGELTRNYLLGNDDPEQYCLDLQEHLDEFAGFNLLIGDRQQLFYVNNFLGRVDKLPPGIYGLSNGELNSDWPKIRRGKARLQQLLADPEAISTDSLLQLMADRQPAADDELPDTGIPKALERSLSSAFIVNPERLYGTVCSTALIIDREGNTRFSEQNFSAGGISGSRHYFVMNAL